MLNKRKKYFKGFTLVEILVVISLIAAVSVFSAVSGPKQLQKARDAVRKSHLDGMKKAIDEYYQDTNCYPLSMPLCTNPLINGDLVIMGKIPCDPQNKLSYTYVPEISSCPSWFQLYTKLENTDDAIIDRINCGEGCGPDCSFNYGVSSANQSLNPFCGAVIPKTPPLLYVCAPGFDSCEVYANPWSSGCPNIYLNDSTCQGECAIKENRCQNASGKNK